MQTSRRTSSSAQAAHRKRAFQVGERAGRVDAGVEQDDTVAGATAQALPCGTPGQGRGKAQAKDAGKHALAPSELALTRTVGHRRRA